MREGERKRVSYAKRERNPMKSHITCSVYYRITYERSKCVKRMNFINSKSGKQILF